MKTDQNRRAAEIVAEAFALAPEDRSTYIADACRDDRALSDEVHALLEADAAAGDFLERPALADRVELASMADQSSLAGTRVNGYRIVRLLATGGMGVVYEAEQDNPPRTVALKVIRAGAASDRSLRRFEHEARVLGLLQHPGIAQIFEAGAFASPQGEQPFFAMEFVHGETLIEYARSKKLDVDHRLELLACVCDAVHYAHQHGVIHRDLKPGNIVVAGDDADPPTTQRKSLSVGQPKILDFGVARLTDADMQVTTLRTSAGELIGTLPYMSPEQVTGQADAIDIRSDVYALGVVLYELLAESLPHDLHDKPIAEAVRIIQEHQITPLSSVRRIYRGDIETIVAKAMEKERERRYQSAAELSADLRRYLDGEAIIARPASRLYQMGKFARRNKALVGGAAIVVVALVAATVVSTAFAIGEARAAREATTEALKAEQVATFLNEMLSGIDPLVAQGADTVLLRHILDETSARIDTELQGHPLVEATIHMTLGSTYESIGELEWAAPHFEEALAIRRRLLGETDPKTLATMNVLGVLYRAMERYDDAEPLLQASLDNCLDALGRDHPMTLVAMRSLAQLHQVQHRHDEAVDLLTEVLRLSRTVHGTDDRRTLRYGLDLARVYEDDDQLDRVVVVIEELDRLVGIQRRTAGEDHPEVLFYMRDLTSLYVALRRWEQAESIGLETLAGSRRVLGDMHPSTLMAMHHLSEIYRWQQRFDDAEALRVEMLETRREKHGDEHPETLKAMLSLANIHSHQGRLEDAEALLEKVLEVRSRRFGEEDVQTIDLVSSLGVLYFKQQRYEEAAALHRRALKVRRRVFGEDHQYTLRSKMNLAVQLSRLGQPEESETLLHEVVDGRTRRLGEEHDSTLLAINNLGALLFRQERYEDAAELYVRALEVSSRALGADDGLTILIRYNLAAQYERLGRDEDAVPLLSETVRIVREKYSPEHYRTGQYRTKYGRCLTRLERYDEAEAVLLEAQGLLASTVGESHQRTTTVVEALVDLYDAWSRPDQADVWRAMLPAPEEDDADEHG